MERLNLLIGTIRHKWEFRCETSVISPLLLPLRQTFIETKSYKTTVRIFLIV